VFTILARGVQTENIEIITINIAIKIQGKGMSEVFDLTFIFLSTFDTTLKRTENKSMVL